MKNKGFANILLIVLVVALAGVLGYVTWVKKPVTDIASTPTPTSSPSAEVTPGDATANWKTYSAAGIQFKYPSDWQIETKKVGVKTEATFLIPKKGNNEFGDLFKISYGPNQGGLTLKEWWAEASKTDGYTKDRENILAGVTAYVLQIPNSGAPPRYVFITKSPNLIIDIAAAGENVEKVLSTFKLLPAQSEIANYKTYTRFPSESGSLFSFKYPAKWHLTEYTRADMKEGGFGTPYVVAVKLVPSDTNGTEVDAGGSFNFDPKDDQNYIVVYREFMSQPECNYLTQYTEQMSESGKVTNTPQWPNARCVEPFGISSGKTYMPYAIFSSSKDKLITEVFDQIVKSAEIERPM